jgi:hypothetical protein
MDAGSGGADSQLQAFVPTVTMGDSQFFVWNKGTITCSKVQGFFIRQLQVAGWLISEAIAPAFQQAS